MVSFRSQSWGFIGDEIVGRDTLIVDLREFVDSPLISVFHFEFLMFKAFIDELFKNSDTIPITIYLPFAYLEAFHFVMQLLLVLHVEDLDLFVSQDVIDDDFLTFV